MTAAKPLIDTFAPRQLHLFDEPDAGPPAQVLASAVQPMEHAAPPVDAAQANELRVSGPERLLPQTDLVEASATPAAPLRHPQTRWDIHLGEVVVGYQLRRASRRTIGFVVGPDGLSVSAPRWVGRNEIEAALREKAAWIVRKLQEQGERAKRLDSARVQWREGASLPFLGEPMILVLDPRVTGAVLQDTMEVLPGLPRLTLHLGLGQEATAAQIRDTVQSWLQRQARQIFEERAALFAQRLGVRIGRLSLSNANTRWGSASANGSIRLNWRLIHFALPVIDYVVTHELAHLREMNHSPAFWDVVRSALPQYEHARGALRTELIPSFE